MSRQTYIATAAVMNLADGKNMASRSRSPEIMGDAAVEILSRPAADDNPILDIFVDKS